MKMLVTLENSTTGESNSCVAMVSDTRMELETHRFNVKCETASTSGGRRDGCELVQCFKLLTTGSSDGAIIDVRKTEIQLRGSDNPSCSLGEYGLKSGFNGTQYHEVCVLVKARSEEGGWDGKGKSGIANCDYEVEFVRTPGTIFEVY
jgi:hypothetical protein